MFKIDDYRALEIAEVLRKTFNTRRIHLFIKKDPQFKALEKIYVFIGNSGLTAVITVANSLISYQLSGRGEDYWSEVGNYFSEYRAGDLKQLYDVFVKFLTEYTRYNKVQLMVKLRRLRTFLGSEIAEKLYRYPCAYSTDQYILLKTLAKTMSQSIFAKTIVFAVKMYYYVANLVCEHVEPDPRVPMPIDRRVAYISLTSGLIRVPDKISLRVLRKLSYKLMQSTYRDHVADAWFLVSRYSGIPCILLDTIVWLIGKYILHFRSIDEITKEFIKDYGLILSLNSTREIFTQFTYALAPYR